jgi:hypothetical protein
MSTNNPFSLGMIKKLVIRYLIELLKFSWLVILLGVVLGSYMYFSKKSEPTIYTSYLSFTVNEASGADQPFLEQVLGFGLPGLSSISSEMGLKGEGGKSILQELIKTRKTLELALFKKIKIENEKGVMKEDFFINHFIDLFGLRKIWTEKKSRLAKVKFKHSNTEIFSRDENTVLLAVHSKIIKSHLFDEISRAGIMTLKFKSPNEKFSYHFVNSFYDELNKYYTEQSIEKQNRIYKAARARKDSLEKAMDGAEKGYISYLNSHNLAASGQYAEKIEIQYLARKLSGEMEAYFMSIKNVEAAKIALEQQTPLLQAIDKPVFPLPADIPNAKKSLLIGALIGMILAVMFVLGRRIIIDFVLNKVQVNESQDSDKITEVEEPLP